MEHEAQISEALAHKYAIVMSFGFVASALVSAVAAWWMGTVGGDHRDRSAGSNLRIFFRKKARK